MCTHDLCFEQNKKTFPIFHLEIIIFTDVEISLLHIEMQIRLECGYSLEMIDSQHRKQRRPLLRERRRTHSFRSRAYLSCVLYAKYHQFYIKSYVVDVY